MAECRTQATAALTFPLQPLGSMMQGRLKPIVPGMVPMDTLGHPPGVALGATFHSRTDLSAAGAHVPQVRDVAAPAPGAAAAHARPVGASMAATSVLVDGAGMQGLDSGQPRAEIRVRCESAAEPSLVRAMLVRA